MLTFQPGGIVLKNVLIPNCAGQCFSGAQLLEATAEVAAVFGQTNQPSQVADLLGVNIPKEYRRQTLASSDLAVVMAEIMPFALLKTRAVKDPGSNCSACSLNRSKVAA